MKKEKTYILFTAGRGPVECSIAVEGVQKRFKKYLMDQSIEYNVMAQHQNDINRSISSIIFELHITNDKNIKPWLGTIQWACKSPIRKFHKRKNWFLKCVKIDLEHGESFDNKEVLIQPYKASGPGGQHRNKVETAIRLTHIPSGITVESAEFRSQLQNKKRAWKKLETAFKNLKKQSASKFDFEKWNEQIEIERGNPIKIFEGTKFIERK